MTPDIGFSYQTEGEAKRRAFRASMPGLSARLKLGGDLLPVRDISAGGMSVEDSKERFNPGQSLEFELVFKDKLIITGLKGEITRRAGTMTGLRFLELDKRQEQRLDKLVLEIQK